MNLPKILLVSQSPGSGHLRELIEANGTGHVTEVSSWTEALKMGEGIRPDVILVDQLLACEAAAEAPLQTLRRGATLPLVCFAARGELSTALPVVVPQAFLLLPSPAPELEAGIAVALASNAEMDRLWQPDLGVVSTDLLGRVQSVNAAALRLTGWNLTDVLARPVPDLVDLTVVRAPLRDGLGGLTGMAVLLRAPKMVEKIKGWPDLAALVQSIADPMFSVDSEWNFSYLNQSTADLFKQSNREELLGQSLWAHLPKSVHREYFHEFSQALTRKLPRTFELFLADRGRWFEAQLYPYGDGLLGLLHEISGRKEAEGQERRMEKLESLGLLARGFAHDFNNLLTVLVGNLSLAEEQLRQGAPALEEVITARKATLQAQGLVQHLLTFARGGAPLKQPTDLAELLREWAAEWPRLPGLNYHFEIADSACPADVDRQQIHRLVHNLVKNAEQAVGASGSVRIRLLPAEQMDKLPSPLPIQQRDLGGWIILQVLDDGCGIPEENLAQIFEPYFTTKDDGNASGLGLTVCESIIKSHGAILTLQSRLGQGTVATIALPRRLGVLAEKTVTISPPTKAKGKRRVLLLEDEHLIRRLSVSHLRSLGCDVVETADGTETLAVYEAALLQAEKFDLVIMDLSIPGGMGGVQTMERLRQMDPAVVAIVSSGYSDDPVMQQYEDYGFRARLPKPYRPEELKQLVEEIFR